jgi:hypothetical protein
MPTILISNEFFITILLPNLVLYYLDGSQLPPNPVGP